MQSPTDHNENANTTKKPPANAVYRSRIEICRILNVLVLEKCQVFAEIGPERLLATKKLLVDEDSEYMVMEYGANKWNNSQLFDHPSLRYNASYLGAYLFFQLSKPSEYLLDHNPAIRFALPDSLLCSQRREFQRINVPPHVPLHCVYKNEKGDFFRANVYDISLDGMGGIVFDENVPL
jgi:c-di-GMP-binding flagellar brake protein YcgR